MTASKNDSGQGAGNRRAWENATAGVMSTPVWLAVCSGNTCRSPLLMFLVRYRLKQTGRGDTVTVESAGVPLTSTGKPVIEGKEMLPFAIEGLRKAAAWLDDQNNAVSDIASLEEAARGHTARIISEVPEDFCARITRIFAMGKHQRHEIEECGLFARATIEVLEVNDMAYDTWVAAGRPATLSEDMDGHVLEVYTNLASELAAHAVRLCS